MPVGLQTWNEFGVMTSDYTSRLGRVAFSVTRQPRIGTTTNARVARGEAFAVAFVSYVFNGQYRRTTVEPKYVSITGTTVSWDTSSYRIEGVADTWVDVVCFVW